MSRSDEREEFDRQDEELREKVKGMLILWGGVAVMALVLWVALVVFR